MDAGAGPPAGEVRFLLNGQLVCESALPRTMTVLEYLRDVRGLTGTKEGCAEGDCGACTVIEGTLAADGRRIQYRAINSCIRFMATLDTHELVSVEDLQEPAGALHPVQQSMVDHHGSQCGFCTPGFVMSLFALYLEGVPATRERVIHALTGNLCRCTGYRPIIDAGVAMREYPAAGKWSSDAPLSATRRAALAALRREQPLRLPGFYAPLTLEQLATELTLHPQSLVLGGGTDVGLWVTKQLRELPPIVYVGAVESLQRIESTAAEVRIGAAVTLTDAWAALVERCPALREVADRFGSPPVRNSGTLCGNLANGSPIGDGLPTLMALGAEIELRRGERTRWLAVEKFYLGYQQKDLQPGEFLVSVRVPTPAADVRVAVFKLSKRIDQDISAVCLACAVGVQAGRILTARVALGGMAGVAARSAGAEQALIGAPWSRETFESAAAALMRDFQPLSDMRASRDYRLLGAANLLRRYFLSYEPNALMRVDEVPLHAAAQGTP
jgi:xanthine dehydrogenase small subunit